MIAFLTDYATYVIVIRATENGRFVQLPQESVSTRAYDDTVKEKSKLSMGRGRSQYSEMGLEAPVVTVLNVELSESKFKDP